MVHVPLVIYLSLLRRRSSRVKADRTERDIVSVGGEGRERISNRGSKRRECWKQHG